MRIFDAFMGCIGLGFTAYGSYIIGSEYFYTSLAGPMNFSFSFLKPFLGLLIIIFGIAILQRKFKKKHFLFSIWLILLGFLLFAYGTKNLNEGEMRISKNSLEKEGPIFDEPNVIKKTIFYSTCFGLVLFGFSFLDKRSNI